MSRVVIVGGYGPALLTFRKHLLNEIANKHNVTVIAPDIDADRAKQLEKMGVHCRTLTLSRGGLNPIQDIRTYLSLRHVFAETRPDVVMPYTIKSVIWGVIAAAREGVPRIVPMITGVGFALTEGQGNRRKLSRIVASVLYPIALRRASIVLFQNPDDLELFRSHGLLPRHIPAAVINGSGVDVDEYEQVPLPNEPSFLMLSRLLGDKGVREYAAAVKSLKQHYPHVRFRLAGRLDQSPDSIGQAGLNEVLDSGVEYLGHLVDVRPAIAEASIYVLPSYREGTPRSTLEAMAMGRAIITTDAPGCRETVEETVNGFLVPARNAEALAASMRKFIESPELLPLCGAQSRRIALEKYDVRKVNVEIMRHAGLL